ncbi:MAG: CotH kinase family protein [Candidatus Rokuibacteriota bacterium]
MGRRRRDHEAPRLGPPEVEPAPPLGGQSHQGRAEGRHQRVRQRPALVRCGQAEPENGADTDPIREGFAWNLHELASVDGLYGGGYHAGLAAWVQVIVNGEYLGLYVNVEERDKQFLKNRGTFVGSRSWLYEIDDLGAGQFELEVGDPHSPTWTTLNYSPFQVGNKKRPLPPTPSDAQLGVDLPALIDMQVMLTQGAIDAFSANGDALFTHGKNFRFADFAPDGSVGDPLAGLKRRYYMWDLDEAMISLGDVTTNIYAQKTRRGAFTHTEYQRVILNHPVFRVQYNDIMSGLLNQAGPLSETALHGFLTDVEAVVTRALATDPYAGFGSAAAVATHFESLRQWISERIVAVLGQVSANQPPPRPSY